MLPAVAESADVAEWMLKQVRERTQWYQEDAVAEIADRFGNDFVYENENGNPAIDGVCCARFARSQRT
jgi:hypothetical protein